MTTTSVNRRVRRRRVVVEQYLNTNFLSSTPEVDIAAFMIVESAQIGIGQDGKRN
jgi:hypothetical protein